MENAIAPAKENIHPPSITATINSRGANGYAFSLVRVLVFPPARPYPKGTRVRIFLFFLLFFTVKLPGPVTVHGAFACCRSRQPSSISNTQPIKYFVVIVVYLYKRGKFFIVT
jgi:hypothetical protein